MRTGAVALLATAGLLLGASLFFGGGSSDGRLSLVGAGAVLVATAALVAVLWGALPLPSLGREGLALPALATGLVARNGVSVILSATPHRPWSYLHPGLADLAV